MVAPARRAAFDILCRIDTGRGHSDDLIHAGKIERIARLDRNLATDLVYGVLRWRGRLDYLLAAASSRPWQSVSVAVKCALRMGLYQMWHLDRVPDHASVSDSVELARSRAPAGAGGFVNAILRQLSRQRPWTSPGFEAALPAWIRVSLPEWLWKRWSSRFGREVAERFALSLNRPPQPAFRILDPALRASDRGWNASDLVPGALIGDGAGEPPANLLFMDEASQLIPHLLGVGSGWTVWDACAAPGGKSAILRELVGSCGFVVSSDVAFGRAAFTKKRLAESGAPQVIVGDASQRPPFRRQFDAVLVDAPCSGLGTLRRNPEIKWRCSEADLGIHHRTQLGILMTACDAVRPGGRLLYVTCSTEPEENETVAREFLAGRPDFSLVRPSGLKGIDALLDGAGFVHTFPSDHVWDGFFAASLIRRA